MAIPVDDWMKIMEAGMSKSQATAFLSGPFGGSTAARTHYIDEAESTDEVVGPHAAPLADVIPRSRHTTIK